MQMISHSVCKNLQRTPVATSGVGVGQTGQRPSPGSPPRSGRRSWGPWTGRRRQGTAPLITSKLSTALIFKVREEQYSPSPDKHVWSCLSLCSECRSWRLSRGLHSRLVSLCTPRVHRGWWLPFGVPTHLAPMCAHFWVLGLLYGNGADPLPPHPDLGIYDADIGFLASAGDFPVHPFVAAAGGRRPPTSLTSPCLDLAKLADLAELVLLPIVLGVEPRANAFVVVLAAGSLAPSPVLSLLSLRTWTYPRCASRRSFCICAR